MKTHKSRNKERIANMCQKYRQKSSVKKNINSKSQDIRKCGGIGGWGVGWSVGAVHGMQRLFHQLVLPPYTPMSFSFILMVTVHITERCGELNSCGFWGQRRYQINGILGTNGLKES